MAGAKRCADCKHVIKTTDEDDPTDVGYECGLCMPFWVPLFVLDYWRWVTADDGAKCRVFHPVHQGATKEG